MEKETIALVGSINRDTICTPDGVRIESYGGMLYGILSLIQMSSVMVFPVGVVGADVKSAVMNLLDKWPQVNLSGLRFTSQKNPHCVLTYDEAGNKQEVLHGGVSPVEFKQIEPFLDCGAICVNFITGSELSLDTMQQVRSSRSKPIFMDVHSLTLTTGDGNRRYFRVPTRWESWVACADFIQCNEKEAVLLAGEPLLDEDAVGRFGERVLALGPVGLVITRGGGGSCTIFRSPEGGITIRQCTAKSVGAVVDETGCGDVFLMGFALEFLRTGDLETASTFANKVAGINCCLRGIEGIGQMGRFLAA